MKRVLTFVFALVAFSATAQEFKAFKVNLSLGYAKPLGAGASGGVLASIEPKYGLSDQIDLGLRYELAAVASSVNIDNGGNGSAQVKGLGSFALTGTYLLSMNNFRPYVGAGLGLYSIAGTSVTVTDGQGQGNDDLDIEASNKLGGLVRVGFKAGHFNLGVEYNIIPRTTAANSFFGTIESKNSYLGVKLGVDIGGGRK